MTWSSFLLIVIISAISILACRVIPVAVFAGKKLPEKLSLALNYIPAAAFAALVANDLFAVESFSGGDWTGFIPIIAAIPVVFVALKTKSLAICIVVGVVCYAILLLI